MRKIAIIAAFLAGLLGLFMSLCGGGFFVVMAYDAIRNLIRSGQQNQIVGVIVLLTIPAGFAVGGAALFWACLRFIRRADERSREKDR